VKKIPTLFVRDPDDRRHLLPEVTPGCEWVLADEGVPTRKYDGTCVMLDESGWWARREVKLGKANPENFRRIATDETTGKTVGWEPIRTSAFYRWFEEAFQWDIRHEGIAGGFAFGTYELIGPKINGNPEGYDHHQLIRHADAAMLREPVGGRSFASLKQFLELWHEAHGIEGIVWHHPDGRMAKLKVRDFR
jgi:Family of unknown function (DUF5565)